MNWGVIVLAGGTETGALAKRIGTTRKAAAVFAGRTSLERTLDAVAEAGLGACITIAAPELEPLVHHGGWAAEGAGAFENIEIGLNHLTAEAILFLPSDSPLIEGPMLTQFIQSVESRSVSGAWLAAGLTREHRFREVFPDMPVRSLRLRPHRMVSGALFAASPAGFSAAADLIRKARASRKSQLAMAFNLGFGNLLRYLTTGVSVFQAERIIGRLTGTTVCIDTEADPATCADFDDVAEYAAVLRALNRDHGV